MMTTRAKGLKYEKQFTILNIYSMLLALVFNIGQVELKKENCSGCKCEFYKLDTEVTCEDGVIRQIPNDLPTNTEILQFLDVDFDSSTLQRVNLSRYTGVEFLKFSRCSLEAIEPGAFRDLIGLRILYLTGTNIKVIQPATFSGLDLYKFYLSDNKGITFHPDAFEGLKVETLDLSNCGLTELNPEVFLPLKSSLFYLFVNYNELRSLPEGMETVFSRLDNIGGLFINNNPWKCDCNLKWFKEYYDSHQKRFNRSPICSTPRLLKKRTFTHLTVQEFKCAEYSERVRLWMKQ